jgi:hypothetical protein
VSGEAPLPNVCSGKAEKNCYRDVGIRGLTTKLSHTQPINGGVKIGGGVEARVAVVKF